MSFRGERFVLDLEDEGNPPENPVPSPFSLIGEIQERDPAPAAPPAPTPTASSTGFPAHRRRNKPSSFKQRRSEQAAQAAEPVQSNETSTPTTKDEKSSIAAENSRHLASMSDAQIQREREELMASIDPGLLERFLRRAKIDEDDQMGLDSQKPVAEPKPSESAPSKSKKAVSFDIPAPAVNSTPKDPETTPKPQKTSPKRPTNDDLPPSEIPKDLHPASERPSLDPAMIETFHFPQPKQPMPTLDPNDPNFLADMQSHYFPEMAHDSSGLSWLKPPSADEEDPDSTSPYHPASSAVSISPSAIRFSLRGTLISPNTSLSLPTTLGLHHHGEDPHAAGYTIPELAILSRSTFPAQRCVAWQVIGRILFRLGRAEFGDRGGVLSEGLWHVIEKEGVVAGMLAEAEGASGQFPGMNTRAVKDGQEKKDDQSETNMPVASGIGRHASAAAWAVEGVWLWQKGGGGDRGLLKEGQIRSQ
ncbi:RNA polymerase II-associated protein 1 N-terminal [Penicillium sp. IBT 35674x]|nr:RNA polymerase II-associated protein 1 N-terminal [Penicillium sp. IBT 35674x]